LQTSTKNSKASAPEIAICMPYFNKGEELQKTLLSFDRHKYWVGDISIVVSIVDDGSEISPAPPAICDNRNIVLSRLPEKAEHMNPCVPLNMAVAQCDSRLVLLQSPETEHTTKILTKKTLSLVNHYKDIVLVPTKFHYTKGASSEKNPINEHWGGWYAHPLYRNVHYWFCQIMTRMFWEEVGGMDERFRAGRSYDDDYLSIVLDKNGANWKWAENCYATHYINGHKKSKNRRGFRSNRSLITQILGSEDQRLGK